MQNYFQGTKATTQSPTPSIDYSDSYSGYYDLTGPETEEERAAAEKLKEQKLLQNAVRALSMREAAGDDKTPEEWEKMRGAVLIDGLARRGEVMVLTAPSKAGKSLLTLQLAHDLVEHRNFLSTFKTYAEEGEKVHIYDMELNRPDAMTRINAVYEAFGDTVLEKAHMSDIRFFSMRGMKIPFDLFMKAAEAKAKDANTCCIIFDCLYTFDRFIENFDENSNSQAVKIMDGLRNLALNTNSVVVLVHHQSKTGNGRMEGNAGSGAGSYVRACDSLIEMIRLDTGADSAERVYRVRFPTTRNFEAIEPIETRFQFPLHIPDFEGIYKDLQPLTDEIVRNRQRNERRVAQAGDVISKCFELYPDGFTTNQAQAMRKKLGMPAISNDTMKQHLRGAGLTCGDHSNGYKWQK